MHKNLPDKRFPARRRLTLQDLLKDFASQGCTCTPCDRGYRIISGNSVAAEPLALTPSGPPIWTPAADALLGTMPDQMLASILGCRHHHVWKRRGRLAVRAFQPQYGWTPERDAVLETSDIQAAANRLGISENAVRARLRRLRMVSPRSQNPAPIETPKSPAPAPTLGQLALIWAHHHCDRHPFRGHLNKNSFLNVRAHVMAFVTFVGLDKSPAAITAETLIAYATAIGQQDLAPSGRRQRICYATIFLLWCHTERYLTELPRNLTDFRQGTLPSPPAVLSEPSPVWIRTSGGVIQLPVAQFEVSVLRQMLARSVPDVDKMVCLVNGELEPDDYVLQPGDNVEFR